MRTAKEAPEKYCIHCGILMSRNRYNGRLEDLTRFIQRRFCSMSCSALNKIKSSPTVAALRKRALKFRTTSCEKCGSTLNVSAHHRDGDLTNNCAQNVGTLCVSCHMKLHHSIWRRGKTATG